MGVGDFIKKGFVTLALATSKVEKDWKSTSEEEDMKNNAMVTPYYRNNLMNDLKEGRLSQRVQEFRKHYYQVLRKSNDYKFDYRTGSMIKLDENSKDEFGQLLGEGFDYDFTKTPNKLNENNIRNLRSIQGDPYDSYRVEISIDNNPEEGGFLNDFSGVRRIKIGRVSETRTKIENYTETIHVRDIDGKNKLLDFYVPKNRQITPHHVMGELEYLKTNPTITDIINFQNMSFVTPGADMLAFEYRMLAFDKVVEYNGYYIVKLYAEVIKDGEWVAEKYMNINP